MLRVTHTVVLAIVLSLAMSTARAAEVIRLEASTWNAAAPKGKEVDAIYGDYVIRNDRIVAVVADPLPSRHANLTVKNNAGGVIDLTRRDAQNDQLSAFYPEGGRYPLRWARDDSTADKAILTLGNEPAEGQPTVLVRYILADGDDALRVETTYRNNTDAEVQVMLHDALRADKTFQAGDETDLHLIWTYDRWFGQAYGFVGDRCEAQPRQSTRGLAGVRYSMDGKFNVMIAPGKELKFARHLIVGASVFDVVAIASKLTGVKRYAQSVVVTDDDGPVAEADIRVGPPGPPGNDRTLGRTDAKGRITLQLPKGMAHITAAHHARGETSIDVDSGNQAEVGLKLARPALAFVKITDEKGGPIPCKVQFVGSGGAGGTKDPYFFVDSGEHEIQNCYYSHDGTFAQLIAPGDYDVIISHGPEYDAVFTKISVKSGEATKVIAKLVRSVDSAGWVSTEYHSHSSPSGDNTSSQLGRVLNLLCENIEFAPCTEHQRLSSYVPHLENLGVRHLMATCVGMELTGSPGDANHQNAFPLILREHTQDNGAPLIDSDPRVQFERLVYWDNKSDKLVQQNHPNIRKVFFDRNLDGKADGGYGSPAFMDVIEVHPPQTILDPGVDKDGKPANNRIFQWMQTLNQGYRIPGVVNTDAHYNYHGSGGLRNWVKSSTDDPAKIDTMEMVHNSERGRLVMSTGPFLEVKATTSAKDSAFALPGDDITAPDGKVALQVRVQCPNWFDINRVQVIVNGKLDPALNFTRKSHPKMFADNVVKFDETINVAVKSDAHLIVVAAGDGLTLGRVMGPSSGKQMPIAVANPIFVDVDGGGFKANGDDLGAALPVK